SRALVLTGRPSAAGAPAYRPANAIVRTLPPIGRAWVSSTGLTDAATASASPGTSGPSRRLRRPSVYSATIAGGQPSPPASAQSEPSRPSGGQRWRSGSSAQATSAAVTDHSNGGTPKSTALAGSRTAVASTSTRRTASGTRIGRVTAGRVAVMSTPIPGRAAPPARGSPRRA